MRGMTSSYHSGKEGDGVTAGPGSPPWDTAQRSCPPGGGVRGERALTSDLQGPLYMDTRPRHSPGPCLSVLQLPGPLETAVLDIFKYLEHLVYSGCVAGQLCHLRGW